MGVSVICVRCVRRAACGQRTRTASAWWISRRPTVPTYSNRCALCLRVGPATRRTRLQRHDAHGTAIVNADAGAKSTTSGTTSVSLRPYQVECLDRILARYREGARRVLVSLPTGTGKTVVFAALPAFFKMQKRMLVLAHREELLEQAAAK